MSILREEIERLKQMLEIAAKDIQKLDGSNPQEYLHDLSTRYYFEEMIGNDFKGHDYKELIHYFDIGDKIVVNTEDGEIRVLREYIEKNYNFSKGADNEEIIKPLTNFLVALIEEEEKYGDLAIMYKSLLKLKEKNKFAFIRMYLEMLPLMWT